MLINYHKLSSHGNATFASVRLKIVPTTMASFKENQQKKVHNGKLRKNEVYNRDKKIDTRQFPVHSEMNRLPVVASLIRKTSTRLVRAN